MRKSIFDINRMVRNRPVKRKPIRQNFRIGKPTFGSILIPQRARTSLWHPAPVKPVGLFWGDRDRDGVYNGLDCEPRNRFKQGPQHRNIEVSNLRKPKIENDRFLGHRDAEGRWHRPTNFIRELDQFKGKYAKEIAEKVYSEKIHKMEATKNHEKEKSKILKEVKKTYYPIIENELIEGRTDKESYQKFMKFHDEIKQKKIDYMNRIKESPREEVREQIKEEKKRPSTAEMKLYEEMSKITAGKNEKSNIIDDEDDEPEKPIYLRKNFKDNEYEKEVD